MKARITYFLETAKDRKDVATTIADFLSVDAAYMSPPTFGYRAGGWEAVADDEGVLLSTPLLEKNEFTTLEPVLDFLKESDLLPSGHMTVDVRADAFDASVIDRMSAIVEGKSTLIEHAFVADKHADASATKHGASLDFFTATYDTEWVVAALQFSVQVYEQAARQKRVTMKEKPVDNEKYAFRCFLLRLQMNGPEYKTTRSALLRHLSGDGSFKTGKRKKEVEADVAQDLPDVGLDEAALETDGETPMAADRGNVAATEGDDFLDDDTPEESEESAAGFDVPDFD